MLPPRAAQHVVAERVQRAHPAARALGHVGEPGAHRVLGPHVVRDRGDRARAPAAVDEQPEALGEHARLARARGRDRRAPRPCRARPPRAGRPRARRCVVTGRGRASSEPLLEVVAMDERVTVGHRSGAGARSAVAPRGRAVGEQHVGDVGRRRAEPLRLDGRAPHHAADAVVVVVRAGEEVEALAPELEAGRERVAAAGPVRSRARAARRRSTAARPRPGCAATSAGAGRRAPSAGSRSAASSITTRSAPAQCRGRGRRPDPR